jgi:hypothetical protein
MILQTEGSTAELHKVDGARIYVVQNKSLERLLFDRNLMGIGFRSACLSSSRYFIRHLVDEFDAEHAAELVILSKGLLYQLSEAVPQETGHNLPTNLIATSRVAVSGDSARVIITYSQLEAPADTLIIGDTVASGATVIESLGAYKENYRLRRLYVLSYAGSKVGALRIAEFCRSNSIACTFLYSLAIFGLGDNGFDLSFLHVDTITREDYRNRARIQFSGHEVSAVGWDFGSQAMAPGKYRHLCWVEASVWGMQGKECFEVAEEPSDLDELSHEKPAYARWLEEDESGTCS